MRWNPPISAGGRGPFSAQGAITAGCTRRKALSLCQRTLYHRWRICRRLRKAGAQRPPVAHPRGGRDRWMTSIRPASAAMRRGRWPIPIVRRTKMLRRCTWCLKARRSRHRRKRWRRLIHQAWRLPPIPLDRRLCSRRHHRRIRLPPRRNPHRCSSLPRRLRRSRLPADGASHDRLCRAVPQRSPGCRRRQPS